MKLVEEGLQGVLRRETVCATDLVGVRVGSVHRNGREEVVSDFSLPDLS